MEKNLCSGFAQSFRNLLKRTVPVYRLEIRTQKHSSQHKQIVKSKHVFIFMGIKHPNMRIFVEFISRKARMFYSTKSKRTPDLPDLIVYVEKYV